MDPVSRQGRPENLTVPAGVEGLPMAIDGLDLQQMRLRLGGDDEILVAILRQFLCDFESWSQQFEFQQRALDTEAMVRLAHTLKGTAANVCANLVHAAALALETALRQGEGPKATLVQACEAALQQLLTALREQLPPEARLTPGQVAPGQARLVMQQVAALLQRRRHVPHGLQQELRAAVAPLISGEQLDALLHHLARFDFKSAQQALADVQGRMSS